MGRFHRVVLGCLSAVLCLLAGGVLPQSLVVSRIVDVAPAPDGGVRVAPPALEPVVVAEPGPVIAPPERFAAVLPEPELPAATQAPRSGDGRWALVIGINRARGAPPLYGAVGDAVVLRDALVAYGYQPEQIIMLLDEEASRSAILDGIGTLADAVGDDGQAVFSFAGHTRRIEGVNHLVAADGQLIAAPTLADALRQVRAPMWTAFPTCYAAGFSLPGIVGPGRIATFASSSNDVAYESRAFDKSFLFEFMVEEAMVQRRASESVQHAFEYARETLERRYPRKVPVVDDQTDGPFILGHLPSLPYEEASEPDREAQPAPSATPKPRPAPSRDPAKKTAKPVRQPVRLCTGLANVGDCAR